MASNLASLAEENKTPNIDFTSPKSISRCLRQHLHEVPEEWMTIRGSHCATSQQTLQLGRVIDFDLKIKALNVRLLRVELGSNVDDSEVLLTDTSDQNSSTVEETIQRCCQAVIDLANTGSYNGCTDRCSS